jgi:hypothetical protein
MALKFDKEEVGDSDLNFESESPGEQRDRRRCDPSWLRRKINQLK